MMWKPRGTRVIRIPAFEFASAPRLATFAAHDRPPRQDIVGSQTSHGVITELLNYLRAHPERVLSREELAEQVWRAKFFFGSRSIDMAVCLARKRLNGAERIVCIRGTGYRYENRLRAGGPLPQLSRGRLGNGTRQARPGREKPALP